MGKKSRAKKDKGKAPAAPVQGFSAELAARLSKGLSKSELSDPDLLRQIAQSASAMNAPSGSVLSFGENSAPTAIASSELPELEPGDYEAEPDLSGTLPLRPSQVIDLHAAMTDTLTRQDPHVLGYFSYFMEDVLSKAEGKEDAYEKWGAMFQPARTAREYAQVLARQLAQARTYQVSSRMVDAVDAIYEKTGSEAYSFQAEDVPWPSGFVYLDKPVSLRDRWGKTAMNRALSWNLEVARIQGTKDPGRPAVRIVCWSWWDDRDEYWTPETGERMRQLMNGLSFAHSVILPFDTPYRPLTERREAGIQFDDVARWLHALWLVMESEIVTHRRASDVERHVAKRAQKSLNHKDVTVVVLRRSMAKELEEGEPGHRYIDWTHRWVVQGFWRHQRKQTHHAAPDQFREHCVVCGIRISWVRPHLRGPSDKPLQVKPQLYKLTR